MKGGLNPRIANNTFKSLVRSKIEYVRTVTCRTNKTNENNIEKLQCKSLRNCMGLPIDTPRHVIFAISGNLPPRFRSEILTARELINLKTYNMQKYINLTQGMPLINSSYSQIFYKFKNILDLIEIPNEFPSKQKLKVESDLQGYFGMSKGQVPNSQIRGTYNDLISKYEEQGFHIVATDASILGNVGCAIYVKTIMVLLLSTN